MRRREFVTLVSGAVAWPLVARAQQAATLTIGFLHSQSPGPFADRLAAFHRGLKEGGYVEGGNLNIEYRWAEGHDDRLLGLAADLVQRRVKLIAGLNSTAAVHAAETATSTIPLVFDVGGDPVKNRLVPSLNRPGGNVTGVSSMNNALGPKRLGLLHDLLPNASVVAALINPENLNAEADAGDLEAAARSMGLAMFVLYARDEREIDAFFTKIVGERISAFLVTADPLFLRRREQITALAAYNSIPALYTARDFTEAGGLMSYGASEIDMWRQAGLQVSRILKGEKPSDLPIIRPTKFELIINLKTSKALGLTVPPPLVATADEVIE
jgi:putative ABC transport system substrate-binding protein